MRGKQPERDSEMHTHGHAQPSLTFLLPPKHFVVLWRKPYRTLRHLSSEDKPGPWWSFCCNNAASAQDWENRHYAWENDILCSLYTPPTNLSIVKMGGRGSMKTLHPTWEGPIWETAVFIIDTWPVLQKYWHRMPDIHWMALKGRFLNLVFSIVSKG